MARRYVPRTYNNKRALRVLIGTVIGFVVVFVAAFLILFFALEQYLVYTEDGVELVIPWLHGIEAVELEDYDLEAELLDPNFEE